MTTDHKTRPLEREIGPGKTSGGRTAILNAALELAANGWAVFPCIPYGKDAKAPYTLNGFHDATTDPDKIKTWWKQWPNALIGGAIPDTCLVIDFDPRHNPRGLDELIDQAGQLPDTLTSWSGRGDGGRHMFFTHHGGEFASTRSPEGIDLKIGGRGYVILPPSPHPNTGQPYCWKHHPVATLPYQLRELLRPAPPPVRTYRGGSSKPSAGLVRTVAGAAVGQRNRILFWASCRAVEKNVIDQIEDELVAAALTSGLTEAAARRTVASARRTAS